MSQRGRVDVVDTVADLREAVRSLRRSGERIAMVPTMGALHVGHASLVRLARGMGCFAIASIFVNPTQFAPHEDFTRYPRSLDADRALLAEADCGLVFAPSAAEMYPDGMATRVTLDGPAKAGLEDAFRPTHFDGVATIVAKLLSQCGPDVAVFGEKDYQQLQVVRRMARDLDLPVDIVGAPTVRDADGLALSSRNRYLSLEGRARAALLPRALEMAIEAIRSGGRPDAAAEVAARRLGDAGFAVDYIAVRDADTLAPVASLGDQPLRILAAAELDGTRLIDNMAV